MPWLGHYVASKHAVTGMAKTLANEVGRYGIRVVSLHPNAVNTHMGTDTTLHGSGGREPAPRIDVRQRTADTHVRPEIVAAAVAYIASDDGRFMTGNEFVIDLGNLCR